MLGASLSCPETHHYLLQQMRELIAEHKPHIDKMNKTGPQLLELSPVEGIPVREKYTVTDQLYTKLKADVKQRAATLDEAISKSTQVRSDDQCCDGVLTGYEDYQARQVERRRAATKILLCSLPVSRQN